ncbi:MAG: MerR family transcriptional regulator [Armatimonadetes bacterium]|nr:MerR family transcriptional regulator [Armatimonadota bacterium]
MNAESEGRYSIADLAAEAGVSRRAVRYYVQQELLPPPRGRGRGSHYGEEHLERLLRLKTLQESGASLERIRRLLQGVAPGSGPAVERWWRVVLADGVELHLRAARPPAAAQVARLAATLREQLERTGAEDEHPDTD